VDSNEEKKKRSSPRYWKEIKGRLYARFQYKTDSGKSKTKYKPITDKRVAKRAVDDMRRELRSTEKIPFVQTS